MSEHKAECLHGAYFHFFTQWVLSSYLGISVTILGLGLLNPLFFFSTLQQNVSQNTFAYGAVMSLLSQMSSKGKLAFRKSLHIDKGFSKTISLDIPSTDIPNQALEQGLRTHVSRKLKIPVTRVKVSTFQEPKGTSRISPSPNPCWKAAWFSGASQVQSKYFVFIPVFHNTI